MEGDGSCDWWDKRVVERLVVEIGWQICGSGRICQSIVVAVLLKRAQVV